MIRGELASEPTLSPEIPQPVEVISLPAEAQSAVSQAIESYLSIQNALYSDQLAGVAPSARRMAEQLQRAAETAPAEKPHFWHQMPEFKILQTKLGDLASATDLKSARVAFGYVGEAFDGLLKTTGVPASYKQQVAGFRCGMFNDAPEGGIWLQVGKEARNPFFGSGSGAMKSCSSEQWSFPVAGRQSSAQGQVSTTSAGAEMSMEEDGEDNSGVQPEMDKALKGILGEYFSLQRALYGDSLDAAAESAATLGSRLEELTSIEVPGQPHFWHQKPDVSSIRGKAKEIAGSRDLDSSRTAFGHLSVALESLIRDLGLPSALRGQVVAYRCGMYQAAPDGGVWLQRPGEVHNPYFGSSSGMKACSSKSWEPSSARK